MSFTQVSIGAAALAGFMVAGLDLVLPNPKPIELIALSYDAGQDVVTLERFVTGQDIAASVASYVYEADGGPEVVECRATGTGDFTRTEPTVQTWDLDQFNGAGCRAAMEARPDAEFVLVLTVTPPIGNADQRRSAPFTVAPNDPS